jgi:hypothetical protein
MATKTRTTAPNRKKTALVAKLAAAACCGFGIVFFPFKNRFSVVFRAAFYVWAPLLNKGGALFIFARTFYRPIIQYYVLMSLPMIDHDDFSVVVKNRAPPPKPWRWEIYRAGRTSPIEHSEVFFESMTEANRAGKAALRSLLSDYPG